MTNKYQLAGDICHTASIVSFYLIVLLRRNVAGISLKAHELYLLVFIFRYLDLYLLLFGGGPSSSSTSSSSSSTSMYSWYGTFLKIVYIIMTSLIVYTIRKVEPAKSTYSIDMDSFNHWHLVVIGLIVALVVHVIWGDTICIMGGSGTELEIHLFDDDGNAYEWLAFFWTYSICLEPLAMIPQLYIFHQRRGDLSSDIRAAISLKGIYRIFYFLNYWHQSKLIRQEQQGGDNGQEEEEEEDIMHQHHYFVYIADFIQILLYMDFFIYQIREFCMYIGQQSNNIPEGAERLENRSFATRTAAGGYKDNENENDDDEDNDDHTGNNINNNDGYKDEYDVVDVNGTDTELGNVVYKDNDETTTTTPQNIASETKIEMSTIQGVGTM